MKDFHLPANVKIPARSKAFYNFVNEKVHIYFIFSLEHCASVKDGCKNIRFLTIFFN